MRHGLQLLKLIRTQTEPILQSYICVIYLVKQVWQSENDSKVLHFALCDIESHIRELETWEKMKKRKRQRSTLWMFNGSNQAKLVQYWLLLHVGTFWISWSGFLVHTSMHWHYSSILSCCPHPKWVKSNPMSCPILAQPSDAILVRPDIRKLIKAPPQ